MMELTDMAEERGTPTEAAVPYTPNPYPWGLRLNITHEQLEKLGYSELPPAGTGVRLEAIATVVRTESCDPDADGDIDYSCIELQIKELGIEEESESSGEDDDGDGEHKAGRAERLYGKKERAA